MNLHPESLAAIDACRSGAGNRVVFVSGTFNIVHPGHLRLLRFAAECGDFLIVGVLDDDLAAKAHLGENTRCEGVAAISWVKHAFILRDLPEVFIEALRPAVVVKGKEHEHSNNPETNVLKRVGGTLLFGSGDTIFSSLELIRNETDLVNHASIRTPSDFLRRHEISVNHLTKALEDFRQLKVCVIGDTIVDEYIQCDPLGMSQEDPTIVVTPVMRERFVGGAGIVAGHAKALGARSVEYISVVGSDDSSIYVRDRLSTYGVESKLLIDASRPTTLKQRFRAGNKTLLRVSHLRQHKIAKDLRVAAIKVLERAVEDADLLIFSDFNYGALPQELVEDVIGLCLRRGIPFFADSQSSSQVGDISRFKGASLITPTEREARLALGNHEDGLVVIAEAVRQKANAENVAMTLAAEGVLIHAKLTSENAWLTDRLEALNTAPKDTAGAGDCLLVCTAMSMALGRSVWEALYLGSLAAACQVGRVGNIPLSASELMLELHKADRSN